MAKFKVKKRCPYCAHVLREDGTCKNEKCVVGYVKETQEEKKN